MSRRFIWLAFGLLSSACEAASIDPDLAGAGEREQPVLGDLGIPSECREDYDLRECAELGREAVCFQYCCLFTRVCAEHPAFEESYTDFTDCVVTCNERMDWPLGDLVRSNSVCCRRFHANNARIEGVDPHCYHSAAVPSAGMCD